jgi:hypothetical protein
MAKGGILGDQRPPLNSGASAQSVLLFIGLASVDLVTLLLPASRRLRHG